MPRRLELTWQPGAGGRKGRWKKKYRGKSYYFGHGRSKSDRDGYARAVQAWRRLKEELERAMPPADDRPHESEYRSAIEEWVLAGQWARDVGEKNWADESADMVAKLTKRLAQRSLPPLEYADRVLDRFSIPPGILENIGGSFLKPEPTADGARPEALPLPDDSWDRSPLRIRRELWKDRLEFQRKKAQAAESTVGSSVDAFLLRKRSQAEAREISAGRYAALKVHLDGFRGWADASLAVAGINGKLLSQYHEFLLRQVGSGGWSSDYAKDRIAAVKTYVRWLWRTEQLESLPRILESQDLRISKSLVEPPVFTTEEVANLLRAATERTKLYLLLMLNCGMTQKDISDLRQSEVNLQDGRIIRKRSKTSKHEGVPTVSYHLWQQTLHLLGQEQSSDPERFFVNENGRPLKTEEIGQDGRLRKNDNISNAYKRLQKLTGIRKPLKVFRKTSATLVRSNERFSGIHVLFLGLSPGSIADRHYARAPQAILDDAVAWLGTQYGIT